MRIHDVSLTIRPGMVVWPGDMGVRLEQVKSQAAGDRANVGSIQLGLHTGTHVDAPRHFIAGAAGVESLALDALIGPVWVADMGPIRAISADDLAHADVPGNARRLLLKTGNGRLWADDAFHDDFAHLTPDAARWIVGRGIGLVGVDYLSVEAFEGSGDTHEILLGAGVAVVEGLNLTDVEQGWYQLCCLPLKVLDGDGAPARVVLISED